VQLETASRSMTTANVITGTMRKPPCAQNDDLVIAVASLEQFG
jgi:hypothetical protein